MPFPNLQVVLISFDVIHGLPPFPKIQINRKKSKLVFIIFSSTFSVVSPTSEYGNGSNDSLLQPDFGLFEASHLACPVLPQYHPKQLMELLNSGKIRWVKAILAHLVGKQAKYTFSILSRLFS